MRFVLIGLLAAGLVACDDHDDDHNHGGGSEGLDAHACEHVTGGPPAAITAAADHSMAVESWEPHHRIDVTLVEMPSGSNGGFVKFTPETDGHYRFLLDADVGFMLHSADNMHTDWAETGAPEGCDAAAKAYEMELTGGTSYLLVFGPTEASSVGVVARLMAEGDEHDHEGDEHDHEGEEHEGEEHEGDEHGHE